MSKLIYLDNAATTQVDPRVLESMLPYFLEKFGNASSVYQLGQESRKAEEKSKKIIAKAIGALPEEIIFTSGGTESNNFALKAIAFANIKKGNHIITTEIEHSCIINTCKWLKGQGFEITYLKVNNQGLIDLEELKKAIKKSTILVSILHGHNEIGVIQPLALIAKTIKSQAYFHTDACQSFTKAELNVNKFNLDLISLNAHKLYGPKGIGALYIRKGVNIEPFHHGGGHQSGLRAGTENISGIVGFGKAVELATEGNDIEHMENIKQRFLEKIKQIPQIKINNPSKGGLPHIISVSFEGIEGEALTGYLDMEGICVSTGSACSSKKLEPSRSLIAIGLSPERANGTVRFSFSRFNTKQEIDIAIEAIKKSVRKLREISPFYS